MLDLGQRRGEQGGDERALRTLGCQSWQELGRPDQDSSGGARARATEERVGLCGTDGAGWQAGCGESKMHVQSLQALAGLRGGRERSAEPALSQHPMAAVLVSKEHSLEGTYVLLFLGD